MLIRAGLLVTSALACALPAESRAQSPPGASAIEEVVVTARRREENLQDVPQAVTALSGERIADLGIKDPIALQFATPELTVSTQLGQRDVSVYTIRGQSQASQSALPAVITYFAEVPVPGSTPAFWYDLENVQVLPGPQGTLFGRNTTGGAVLFTPRRPTFEVEGYGQIKLGDYDLHSMEGAVNIPVSDTFAIRLAGDRGRREGFTRNVLLNKYQDDVHYDSYRLGLLWRPNDRLENYTIADYYRVNNNGNAIILNAFGNTARNFAPGIVPFLAQQQQRGPRATANSLDSYTRRLYWGVANITTFNITDDLLVKNIVAYRRKKDDRVYETDGTPFEIADRFFDGEPDNNEQQYTEELQFQGRSFDQALNWIAGFYGERISPRGFAQATLVSNGVRTFFVNDVRHRSNAVFAQGTYRLPQWPQLSATAGVRKTWDYRSLTSSRKNAAGACTTVGVPPGGICRALQEANFEATTWNLSLEYKLTEDILAYVSNRRGYKSGGFNQVTTDPSKSAFGPEYLTDVEAGVKADWTLGGMDLRTNLAVFAGKYTDIQVTGIFPDSPLSQTKNAADATIRGADLQVTLIPITGVELSGFYSWIDSEYGTFVTAAGDQSGLPFVATPQDKAGLTARVDLPVSESLGEISAIVNWYWQSSLYFVAGDPFAVEPDYSLVNFRINWRRIMQSSFDAALFVTNASDRLYRVGVGQSSPANVSTSLYGEPRMAGIELRYNF